MPKSLLVDPERLRRRDALAFTAIPVRAYVRDFAEERDEWGDAGLVEILRRMTLVREFEAMLTALKATGRYGGIEYAYKGPAHLSIGQEAAAVGAALALGPDDHIYGSHRSHGEFIAKGLSAIAALDEAGTEAIMEAHADGALLRAVERAIPENDPRRRAENFLLLGLLAEIFMRAGGFNGGMGGSMHAFFPPFGAFPNNAIVGASAGIAAGAALRMRHAGGNSIAVAMVGDGATGCGPVWEAMNFAAMRQFQTLHAGADGAAAGGLPALFFFVNNFYAMGGQTMGETMAWDRLARIGAGLNPEALHAETVDGGDPLAVAEAVRRKAGLLRAGAGPALLDVECYRVSGHSSSDVNAYRSKEEMAAWAAHDPLESFAEKLLAGGVLDAATREAIAARAADTIAAVARAAADPGVSRPIDLAAAPTLIGGFTFADRTTPPPAPAARLLAAPEATARMRQHARKSRSGRGPDGAALSPMRAITLRDGLFEAILDRMLRDDRLVAYGEECREWGGAFGVYRGLADIFPHARLFNAPISEAAIVATAVGYALEGGRALVELMYADFIGRAGDEIFNQMAKWRAMSGGQLAVPVVLRASVGSKYGAQHSQDWSALCAHVPGLKVVYPATPYDAKGLMAEALAGDDPVVFFESQRLYDRVEIFQADGVPEEIYRLPLGVPEVRRRGGDVTILTIGPSLYPALAAAETLAEAHGVTAEVIDARCLVPFDYDPVLASLKRTGRLLVVSEACERGSFAMTLAANLARFGFADLKAPPRVLGAPNWIVPGADLEETHFPGPDAIVDALTQDLMPEIGAPRRGIRTWDDRDLARRGL